MSMPVGNKGNNVVGLEQWTWSLAKNPNCIQLERLDPYDIKVINKSIRTIKYGGGGGKCSGLFSFIFVSRF